MINQQLLSILVCPLCKGSIYHQKKAQELICKPCRLAYPIRDDIPIMLENEARSLSSDEIENL